MRYLSIAATLPTSYDLGRGTVPLNPEQALARTVRLYARLDARRVDVEKLDSYYRGVQPLAYASEQWRKFHAGRYKGFSDNWCGVVGNSPSERLRVEGFRLDDDQDHLSGAEKVLWDSWLLNDMDAQSSQGFLSSIVAKRSAVLVWGDADDEPVYTWEHPSQVIVDTDPATRRRTAALKSWISDGLEFATLYLADEVWKFQRDHCEISTGDAPLYDARGNVIGTSVSRMNGGTWRPREVPDETWPLVNPLGEVPVVEFPNRPMLGGEPMSDIQGTMAMQDAINMLWAYLFTAADHASMPARVVLGAELPKVPILDAQGQVIGAKPANLEDIAQGRLLFLPGQGSSMPTMGQWDAARLDVFTGVIELSVSHIAAQTRTPQHYLIGKAANTDNAEALKAAETGLVKKVEEQQLFFSSSVREVFRLGALVRGDAALALACRLGKTLWKDAENRSDAQRADALLKKRSIGYPLEYLLEQDGLPPLEVARVLAMVAAEPAPVVAPPVMPPDAVLPPTI